MVVLAADLERLASNLWWTWSREAMALWSRIAEEVPPTRRAELLRNPLVLSRALGSKELRARADDAGYLRLHRRVLASLSRAARPRSNVTGLTWKRPVAYFSMEFGLHESLPIYCGGLGLLAGDHLKSASDEGVPLVGVGLLYRKGYFDQRLTDRGRMEVHYPALDFRQVPLEPVKRSSGRELRLTVELPDGAASVKVWRLRAGQVPLYLLDTDIPENGPAHRRITHHLYGGSREDRIRQEVLLGIGGVRALEALGIEPGAWHLNEGHVAFLALERLRRLRERLGLEVHEALEALAADTVFTTHTPVPEGNETFDPALVARYLKDSCDAAGMTVEQLLGLGLDHTAEGSPTFSMTVLALELSRFRGGVSKLHGQVARGMWSFLWSSFPEEDVPIGSVTNGVHITGWIAPQIESLFDQHVGQDWRSNLANVPYWKRTRRIPSARLWRAKQVLKDSLIDFVRRREDERLRRCGWSAKRRRMSVETLLDPHALTIGFARRFALYKRAALIFSDPARAARLFGSTKRPVQIIFAGKPHPEDPEGRNVFERISSIARRAEFRGKVAVLENYDIEVCRAMVHGVDVWLNNPRRPLEASGTSGQKAAANGGLNVSILDGWWEEGYSPETGWAFGEAVAYEDLDAQDRDDARALYHVLEREVVPLYYERGRSGVPERWTRKMKTCIAALLPRFSSHRMVRDYAEEYYLPAQARGRIVQARKGAVARELIAWKERVSASLSLIHIRRLEEGPRGSLRVEAFLGSIDPRSLLCWSDLRQEHAVTVEKVLGPGLCRLRIDGVSGGRGRKAGPRELRLFPSHPALAHPQELGVALELELPG